MSEDPAVDPGLTRLAGADLNLLLPLLVLLEERSVTRAAERLDLTQPAMSHALRRIRRLLDDEVLVRRGATMVPTPRAEQLVTPLRQALHQVAGVVQPERPDPSQDARVVTCAMTTSTAFVIGGALSRTLAERAPQVVLKLHTETPVAVDDLFLRDRVDLVLLSQAFDTRHPRTRLYDDRWAVVSAADVEQPGERTVVDRIRSRPHVAFDSAAIRIEPYAALQEHQVEHTVRWRVSDSLLIPDLVAATGGIAFHRQRVAARMATRLPLRVEEFPFAVQTLGIDLVRNPWLSDDPFYPWLEDLLRDVARTLPGRPPRSRQPPRLRR